ncbi:MAG: hypothetical protein FJ271_24120 [Planctomycetes bacterium]|nr:hypothetical protein [Planctomycetota bacterium]
MHEFLVRRHQDYVQTFNGPVPERVLADLAKFCRAGESTFHPDARVHAVLEGRREVWLRIQKYLRLSAADVDRLAKDEAAGRGRD